MAWPDFWSSFLGSLVAMVPFGVLLTYYASKLGTREEEREEKGTRQ